MTFDALRSPETKAVDGPPTSLDVVGAFDDFMRAFEAFKETNDERLAEIEQRLSPDAVTTEKLARLDEALDRQRRLVDELALKGRRPALAGAEEGARPEARERRGAFDAYVRRGDAGRYGALEAKALVAGTDAQGGYLAPDETEREIGRRLAEVSPIRAIATVRAMTGSVFRKPFATEGFASGWAAETAARAQSATPALDELAFPAMELFAMPAATQTLLDDAAVDLDQWIAEEVETAFAEQESVAFVTGDGVTRPQGFLTPAKVANSAWEWGKIGYVPTGAAGAFAASHPSDALLDLVYALRSGYRREAHFVLNRRTQAAVRKLKDADGRYLWEAPAAAGAPATLMGFPIAEAEAMPDIAENAHAIAFGDFRRGYLVADRIGVRILRDPFTAKPYVLFYTTKRVGGGVQDFDAIKTLRFAAS
ncbi:phage capsid protein [Methylopila jiangsuensis]|uniref:Phage capsid protein n=1 Tax=Methylopila jiangsuensis TaxID=586230 RepID=A0A9W6N385_9HYPH|nr:phage major capsid protein [Methylopila jiangsuensis]MDR6286240.1 HK97 family phage major capsid protein [Methylopila jiangsuensis]GLK76001.1 phage capsid protein [Methylopila jiangsuensis]